MNSHDLQSRGLHRQILDIVNRSLTLAVLMVVTTAGAQENPAYKDASLPVEARVADLLKRMTPEEKARQLDMYAGNGYVIEVARQRGIEKDALQGGEKPKLEKGLFSEFANPTHVTADAVIVPETLQQVLGDRGVGSFHDIYPLPAQSNALQEWVLKNSRLPIPALFVEEGLHGSLAFDETTFPAPINLGSTWSVDLAKKTGVAIAAEMRANGVTICLGPVLDLSREPRWGRVEETMGEDPWLVGQLGLNYIQGMQGASLATDHTMGAVPKHFAGHGSPEAGQNASALHAGEREIRSSMLKTFEPAIKTGKAISVMAAYHEIDGVPSAANAWLMRDVLRKEWGFRGFVISDLGAIRNLFVRHHVVPSAEDAVCLSINAGMNMQFFDFPHEEFQAAIVNGLKNGKLGEEVLDQAVGDVLRAKFEMGLFENPYVNPELDEKVRRNQTHLDLALASARQSMCLLKNENNTLPLSKKLKRIAILGANGNIAQLGDYSEGAVGRKCVTMLDAIRRMLPGAEIIFDEGKDVATAIARAKGAEVIILGLGERQGVSGEGHDRMSLDLPDNQQVLAEAAFATGIPTVLVLQNGRPLTITWAAEHIPAILEAWYPGERGGEAIAETLFGDNNPAGRLPVTFPRSVGQIPVYYGYNEGSRVAQYTDGTKDPLYIFGFGLSYTSFKYDNLKIIAPPPGTDDDVKISVDITNTGKVDGDEVPQVYVRQKVASVVTPNKALKAFDRLHLKAGEKRTVEFFIRQENLAIWNLSRQWVVEPGEFAVGVGGSSNPSLQGAFAIRNP